MMDGQLIDSSNRSLLYVSKISFQILVYEKRQDTVLNMQDISRANFTVPVTANNVILVAFLLFSV